MDYIEQKETLDALLDDWLVEFKQSPTFFTFADVEKAQTDFTIQAYGDFMLSYFKKMPSDWNKEDTFQLIVELFPMKLKMDDDFVYAFSHILSSFFYFLSESNAVQNAAELAEGVLEGEKQLFLTTTPDEDLGEMTEIFQHAISMGVDLNDEAQVDTFIANFLEKNANQTAFTQTKSQPIRHEKIGRNDPCPCGSGKKYKKCCG